MKIEKISDNSIRCTLNRADLESRELKLSELAYGSEKAKTLFKDMIAQASFECGFEAEDIPLMIEAIPVSMDCIILVITKVEDPEELDTRFSKFAPTDSEEDYEDMLDSDDDMSENVSMLSQNEINDLLSGAFEPPAADDFIPFNEMLKKKDEKPSPETSSETGNTEEDKENVPTIIPKLFSFVDYTTTAKAAAATNHIFCGGSKLYKNASNSRYYLLIDNTNMEPDAYTGVCNILTEYGNKEKFSYATESFLKEHCEVIIKKDAVKVLTLY